MPNSVFSLCISYSIMDYDLSVFLSWSHRHSIICGTLQMNHNNIT